MIPTRTCCLPTPPASKVNLAWGLVSASGPRPTLCVAQLHPCRLCLVTPQDGVPTRVARPPARAPLAPYFVRGHVNPSPLSSPSVSQSVRSQPRDQSISLSFCHSVISQSVCRPPVRHSVSQSIRPSVRLLSIRLPVCLPVCLSVRLSFVHPWVRLPVCQSV